MLEQSLCISLLGHQGLLQGVNDVELVQVLLCHVRIWEETGRQPNMKGSTLHDAALLLVQTRWSAQGSAGVQAGSASGKQQWPHTPCLMRALRSWMVCINDSFSLVRLWFCSCTCFSLELCRSAAQCAQHVCACARAGSAQMEANSCQQAF